MPIENKVLEMSKLVYKDGEQFVPSMKEQALLDDTVDLFRRAQAARNRNFQYFDGLNLIDYIDDSVVRFNTNVDEREGIEDWQAGVNDPFTRNKVLAILGKVMEVLPIAKFTGRNDEDQLKASILTDVYHYVEELDDYDEFMTHLLLESIVKGTGIGYEDVDFQERTFRNVEGVGDDITVTESKDKVTKIYSSIVPLEEFYPSSVAIRKIKDMPYCFWAKDMNYSKFVEMYGHFRRSELVQGKRNYAGDEMRPYYADLIDANTADGDVHVMKYFDKMHDQYVIIANGIWLNPIKVKDGEGFEDTVSPLPWNHKELPFWEVKFDFFGDFFYGKSLPDRLKSMQDVLNVLTNMLLDQSFLTIFPPLLTNGFDSIEDDYMRPGRRTPVDTQGLPISQAFQVLQQPTPSGWHQYILEYTRQVMEESSLDKVSSGTAGGGDRTTAQEIRVAASGVAAMLQMFARMVDAGVSRKAFLKGTNTMQFGFNTEAPILRQVLGEGAGADANKAFVTFRKEGSVLSGGKRGTKIIEVYKDKASMPKRADVKARALVSKADSDTEVEIVAIDPTYLRNLLIDVKITTDPKRQSTQEVEKALQLEKVKVYKTFWPEKVNDEELLAETAEKMGDDPAKIINPDVLNPSPAPENGPNMNQEMSTVPQDNTSNNLARSARGGEVGGAALAASGA